MILLTPLKKQPMVFKDFGHFVFMKFFLILPVFFCFFVFHLNSSNIGLKGSIEACLDSFTILAETRGMKLAFLKSLPSFVAFFCSVIWKWKPLSGSFMNPLYIRLQGFFISDGFNKVDTACFQKLFFNRI